MIPPVQALQEALQQQLRQGGQIAFEPIAANASEHGPAHDASSTTPPPPQYMPLFEAAKALDLAAFTIHCDKARNRSAVLRAVVKAVDFPEFFGGDLEAFFDCLCDTLRDQKTGVLLWFDKLHSGDPDLAEDAAAIIAVCEDAAQFARNNDKIFAFAINHTGKHPDPEPGVAPVPYAGSQEDARERSDSE